MIKAEMLCVVVTGPEGEPRRFARGMVNGKKFFLKYYFMFSELEEVVGARISEIDDNLFTDEELEAIAIETDLRVLQAVGTH